MIDDRTVSANNELTSTQKGVIAEHIVANGLMKESNGRLSPFSPLADEGIDLLVYDKRTGKALPIQIKSRTGGIVRYGRETNTIHFEIRSIASKKSQGAFFLAVLMSKDLRSIERAWFVPMKAIPNLFNTRQKQAKYIMRPNKNSYSRDKFRKYQCLDIAEITKKILDMFGKINV